MTYEEACETMVSRDEALAELARHYIVADYEGRELFDCVTGETIAWMNADNEVSGSDILGWLGY